MTPGTEIVETPTPETTLPTGEVSPVQAVKPPEESATPEEIELAELEAAPPEDKPAKKQRFVERMGELTRKRREAEETATKKAEEAAYWKGVAEGRIAKQSAATEAKLPEVPKPFIPPKPDKAGFTKDVDGYAEYDQESHIEALAEWAAGKARAEDKHAQEQERVRTEIYRKNTAAAVYIDKVAEKYPDFRQLIAYLPNNDTMADAIIGSVNNVEVGYYLAKNPAEAARIARLEPLAAVLEIGRLDAKFETPSLKQSKTPSAPPPITPVISSGPSTVSEEKMTTEEWIAAKNREEFGERQ